MTHEPNILPFNTEQRLPWSFDEPEPWSTSPDDERVYRVGISLMAHVEVPHDRRMEGAELDTCVSVPAGKVGWVLVPASTIADRVPFLLDGILADTVQGVVAHGIAHAMDVVHMIESRKLQLGRFDELSWMGGPPDQEATGTLKLELPDGQSEH